MCYKVLKIRFMKKILLIIGLVIASVVNVFGQENDTAFIDTNSIEYKALYMEVSQLMANLIEPRRFLDHTHLRNNMMQILLSDDNSELFKSIDDGKKYFGSITYFKMLNGSIIYADGIVPYDEPNITVYNTTIMYDIIKELKLNYPKTKSYEPDDIELREYDELFNNLKWKFKNNKTEYLLQILFDGKQIKEITFTSNTIQ